MGTADKGDAGPSPELPHWDVLARNQVADCRVFRVLSKTCRHPGRERAGEFFVIDASDWVNVVAVTEAGEVVLVWQYRFGTERLSLEVPGGVMEEGEDPVAAARRELLEETGFEGGEARLLGRVSPNPAIQDNTCHLVLLEGVRHGAATAWDEHEEIEVLTLPAERVFELVRGGRILHALALNALLLFELDWRRRRHAGR